MPVSGNADAAFIFETNIEEVARRVATGYAEIEGTLNRSAGHGGSSFLEQQRAKLDALVKQKAGELDAIAGKYARGENNPSRTFASEQARIGQQLGQAINKSFREALTNAPAQLPVSKLRDLFSTIAQSAFAGLGAADLPTRALIRSAGNFDDLGKNQNFERYNTSTQAVLGRTAAPENVVSNRIARLEAERSAQRQANVQAETLAEEERIKKAKGLQAISDEYAAKQSDAFAKKQDQLLQAQLLAMDKNTRAVTGNPRLRAQDRQDPLTGEQTTQYFDRFTAQPLDRQPNEVAAEAEKAAIKRDLDALEKLAAADEKQLQLALLQSEIRSGATIEMQATRGVALRQNGDLVNTKTADVIDGAPARDRILEAEAELEQRNLSTMQVAAAKRERTVAAELDAENEIRIGLELQAQLVRKEAVRVGGRSSSLIHSSVDDRFYRETKLGATGNFTDLQTQGFSERLKVQQDRELREQTRISEALEKRATEYSRQGLTQNFLGGLTSRGFGGQGGFSGNFNGLAQAAGVTAKYAATSTILFGMIGALKQAATEYVDFADSNTELSIAMGGTEHASGALLNSLSTFASNAGTNVGEAMDVAAAGIRAFQDQTDGTKESIEELGAAFDKQASRIAVLAKTTLTDAAGNLKSTAMAFDITPDDTGFAQITDALVGAKRIGGGSEKEISQGIASAGVAAHQAGFDVNELGILISRVQAKTDQSGMAIGQSFSRAFSIIGGSAGRTAIGKLNATLADSDKIDMTAGARKQILQLSKVFPKLSSSQQGVLINALGGTASARQITVLLQEANGLIGDQAKKHIEAGEGAKEYDKRMKDLAETLKRIVGELKNIAVFAADSGLFTVVGGLIHALDKVLGAVKTITGSLEFVKKPIREAIGAALGLYAAFKLIEGVKAAGGIGAFMARSERTLTPGRAAARVSLADAEKQAQVGRLAAVNPLANTNNVRLDAAATELDAAAKRLAAVLTENAVQTAEAGKLVVEAEIAGGEALEAALAIQAEEVQRAVAAERAARAELAEASSAEAALKKQAVADQRALVAEQTQIDRQRAMAAARALAREEGINAALERREITEVEAATAIAAAAAERVAVEQELDVKLAAAAIRGGAISPGNVLTRERELDLKAAAKAVKDSFKSAATAIKEGGAGLAASFKEAATLVREGGSVEAAAAASGGGVGGKLGAAWGKGGLLGPGRMLGKGMDFVGGPAMVAMLGAFAVSEVIGKTRAMNAAIGKSEQRLSDTVHLKFDNPGDLKDAASRLREGAQQVKESSDGLIAGTLNHWKGDPTGKQSSREDAMAARLEAQAAALTELLGRQATSSNANDNAQVFDLTSETGVADGLALLAKEGRGAETQARALAAALDNLGGSSKGAADRLNNLDQLKYTDASSNAIMGSVRDFGDMYGGSRALANLGLGTTPKYEWLSDANKIRHADMSKLGDDLDATTKDFFDRGGNVLDPKQKATLITAQKAVINRFLDSIDFSKDPKARKSVMDGAFLGASTGTAATGSAKDDPQAIRDQALADLAGSPQVAQMMAQRAGVQSSLDMPGNGRREGDAVASARANLEYMKRQRAVAAQKLKDTGMSKKDIKEALELADDQIDELTKAFQTAQLGRMQTLAQYAANKRPQTDTVGRLDIEIKATRKALETATGDDYEKLQDQLLTQQQQRAVAAVARSNAETNAGVDSRDKNGQAAAAVTTALATLNQIKDSGDTTSEAYWNAKKAYDDSLVQQSLTAVQEANLDRSTAVGLNDSVGNATANYKNARDLIATTLAGSPERRAAEKEARAQFYAEVQAKTERANSKALAKIDPRDTIANDRQAVADLRRKLAEAKKYTPDDTDTIAKLQRQIAEANQKTLADTVGRNNARRLAGVDSRDTVGTARVNLRNAQAALSLTEKGTADYYAALKDVNDQKVALATAEITLADARERAGIFGDSAVSSAKADLDAAIRAMNDDKKNSVDYYTDLAALHQAQRAYAEAQAVAAQNAYLLTTDLTDPVAQAQASLKEAADKLARDRKAGAPKDVLDADKIAQINAANALEAAQFDDRMNKWDVADRLGRITHAQHMAYLQGEHDRLSAIVNRTYQQQQELDQVDLALKDIKDNINSAMSGQFNLGDIKVPTVYEVRRSLAVGTGSAGGAGTVDNSTSNTTVYVNGADFAKVVEYLEYALGQSAQVTRTTGGRKP